jgi:hypothetical protein
MTLYETIWITWVIDFIQIVDFPLHSDALKPGDLYLSPMQPSIPVLVLS